MDFSPEALLYTFGLFVAVTYGVLLLLVGCFAFIYIAYVFIVVGLRPLVSLLFGKTTVFIGNRHLFLRERITLKDVLTFRALLAFFRARNFNMINIITAISVFGITVGTAALIIVLSVFNGFHALIDDLYSRFDPDIKVTALKGKTMEYSEELITSFKNVPGVAAVGPTVENKCVMQYFDKQHIVNLKGVQDDYQKVSPIDGQVYEGEYAFFGSGNRKMAVLGGGVAYYLNANLNDLTHPIKIFVANEDLKTTSLTADPFLTEDIFPSGYFSVQKEYDDHYALVDFGLARKLFQMKDKVTAYEIRIMGNADEMEVKGAIQELLGPKFKVQTRFEQHQTLYEVMQNEKLVAYLVLCLMLIVAGVNIVGSLSMIVLEKTKDIAVLRAMGLPRKGIVSIFLYQGFTIGLIGGIAGAAIGLIFGILQMEFGILEINGGDSFVVDAFPLQLNAWDFVVIFFTVFILSIIAAIYPAVKASFLEIPQALSK